MGHSRSASEVKAPSHFNSLCARSTNPSHKGGCHEIHSEHDQGPGLWYFPVS